MRFQLIAIGAVASLALAGCASSPGYSNTGGYNTGYGNSGYSTSARCADCGIVTRINTVQSGRTAPAATGAVLGGIIIGLLENVAQYVDSEYLHWGNLYEIAPFYVLIIILMIKPYGLFGTKDIERV